MTFIKLNLKEWRLIYFITACQFFSGSAKVTKERVPNKKKEENQTNFDSVAHFHSVCACVCEYVCVCEA